MGPHGRDPGASRLYAVWPLGRATWRRGQALGRQGWVSVLPPIALTTLSIVLLVMAVSGKVLYQGDFNGDIYLAGSRILHGLAPYQPQLLAHQAAIVRAGGTLVAESSPRYPPFLLVLAAPLSLLPVGLADLVFVVLSGASVIVALRLLGVRDWRCFVVAGLSWPVVEGVWLGNVSPLLLLGAAIAWRWRDRVWPVAAAVASVVVAKLFVWPLGFWLLATRRFRTFARAALIAVLAMAVGWAAIGFDDLTAYPRLLLNVASIGEGRGCSLVASLIAVGVSPGTARIIALACGLGLIAVAWRLARLPDGDRRAFGLVVVASLIATPVAWVHYLVLLFIPIALLSPGLSALWFLPMLAGVDPGGPVAHPALWVSLPALAIEFVVVCCLCWPLLAGQERASGCPDVVRPDPERGPLHAQHARLEHVRVGTGR